MAFADQRGHWISAIFAALAALFIQIATNYANDYYDFVKGSDKAERLGPTRATAAGWVSPHAMKRAFIIVFALAALCGIYLFIRAGWPVLVIGVFSIAAGILYTGGPYPIGYHGLGDLFVFFFFGLVAVGGTYYVQTLHMNAPVILAGVAPGLFSTAILTVNNLRDIENDKHSGKRTLPVLLGSRMGRLEYVLCIIAAGLTPLFLILLTKTHYWTAMASLILIAAIPSIRLIYTQPPSKRYNNVLAATGQLLFGYSILFALGWLL